MSVKRYRLTDNMIYDKLDVENKPMSMMEVCDRLNNHYTGLKECQHDMSMQLNNYKGITRDLLEENIRLRVNMINRINRLEKRMEELEDDR